MTQQSTLQERLTALAQAIGQDVGLLESRLGDLSSLTTTAQTNLVAALNSIINDVNVTAAHSTLSAAKIDALLTGINTEIAQLRQTSQTTYGTIEQVLATKANLDLANIQPISPSAQQVLSVLTDGGNF